MDPGGAGGYPHTSFMPPPPQQQQQQFQYHGPPPPVYPMPPAVTPGGVGAAGGGFFNPWEAPPPQAPPPPDADLQRRIEKLVEYAAKNGPQFEALMKDKQKENPAYAFLFGAEGHDFYRYRLWLSINPRLLGASLNPAAPPALAPPASNPNLPSLNPLLAASLSNPMNVNSGLASIGPPPQQQSGGAVFRPPAVGGFFPHQQQQQGLGQPFFEQYQHESYGQYSAAEEQLIPPMVPPDLMIELKGVLDGLTGTKESIKGAKMWFMQRAAFGPALAEAMRDRVLALDGDVERQLHVIYLANDILFNSLQHRANPAELDGEALAFSPVLGSMLAAVYHNQVDPLVNQERLQKILQFWGVKEVFDKDTINALEGEMVAGPPPPPSVSSLAMHASAVGMSPMSTGLAAFQFPGQWQSDQGHTAQASADQQQLQEPAQQSNAFGGVVPAPPSFFGAGLPFTAAGASQYLAGSAQSMYPSLPVPSFLAPLPTPVTQSTTPVLAQLPNLRNADQPSYPLFPPGLIPGMVRKMQIGSGVPYSPVSPLDIPTAIPPSNTTESYILERVAKFFKEIGEADPLEGQFKEGRNDGDDEGEAREGGGARIPPPSHMQADPDTGALPDGSVERRPGVGSTGRLGLGAAADVNEVTQYDDVYTSYRKQRSTNYHTSLSARAAAAR